MRDEHVPASESKFEARKNHPSGHAGSRLRKEAQRRAILKGDQDIIDAEAAARRKVKAAAKKESKDRSLFDRMTGRGSE